jgi:hypothetical protein
MTTDAMMKTICKFCHTEFEVNDHEFALETTRESWKGSWNGPHTASYWIWDDDHIDFDLCPLHVCHHGIAVRPPFCLYGSI